MDFNKPATTYAQQLAILKSRGLAVADEPFAMHCLEHHNYYRLSAYRFPLSAANDPDQFKPGTTFEQLWGLYCFDRQLRALITEAVKRLEISLRSRWAYVLAHAYGSQAYEDKANFKDAIRHLEGLQKLNEELARSDEVFVGHYRTKYGMKLPPIWVASEILSFGLLSRFYENILRDRDRKEIARAYGLYPDTLKSLLEHAVYIRNLCAHHARLWNRKFTITVTLPRNPPGLVRNSFNFAEDRRIYNTLVLLSHIVDVVEPLNHWAHRLMALLGAQTFPVMRHMGFPEDWETRPMWAHRRTPHAPTTQPSGQP